MLQPINQVSEYDGIKMEIVAAVNDDEMAVVDLTITDLTNQRIDKPLDIYDFFITGANMFNCQVIDYDETIKTAILRMLANGGKKLNGKKLDIDMYSISFGSYKKDDINYGGHYIEYVFNIADPSKLNRMKLKGNFVACDNYLNGNWKTTFRLDSVGEIKEEKCNIEFDNGIITNITISPLGVTLYGYTNGEKSFSDIDATINLVNGISIELDQAMRYTTKGKSTVKFIYAEMLKISNINSVTINVETINFSR